MGNLKTAITNYIKFEKLINENVSTRSSLEKKHDEKLRNQSNDFCTVDESENIYQAYQAIETHQQEVEKYKINIKDAEDVIIKYLSSLNGKKISGGFLLGDDRLTYSFWIGDNGKVCHNHQKNN